MVNKKTNIVQEVIMLETERVLNTAYKGLVQDAVNNNNRLPESIFVSEFLPFFSGQVTRESRPNILATWISIAGSPGSEVSVIDPSGNVLYNVPGVFDTSFLTLKRGIDRGHDYDQLIDHSKLLSNNMPQQGNKFLTEALVSKFKTIASQYRASPNEQKWIDIFHRYGISIPGYDQQANDINGNINSVLNDEEY